MTNKLRRYKIVVTYISFMHTINPVFSYQMYLFEGEHPKHLQYYIVNTGYTSWLSVYVLYDCSSQNNHDFMYIGNLKPFRS